MKVTSVAPGLNRATIKSNITQPAATPEPVDTVEVSHSRELRGAWVATVYNINYPSSNTLDAAQQKQELLKMLDILQDSGFNSIFFQVRPEGDALYKSELEPWSSSLSGTQGQDPGYDPLQTLIEQAHKRNIEVHAWLNPYRAKAAAPDYAPPHVGVEHPQHVHEYGRFEWMDPGAEVVRERLVDVCRDLTQRYDIDGIHFDDYFYPYPNGQPFPDDATWQAYRDGGGQLERDDWRRENVNRAVREVNQAVREAKPHVRFGISPFGIPAPDKPEGISGFDQYEGLFADTQHWMDEGWVDYLAPQLYWPTTKRAQAYETLIEWWSDHAREGHYIFAGNNLSALGSSSRWPVDEFRTQIEMCRARADQGAQGNIWWNIAPLLENRDGIADTFSEEFYAQPALTPALAGAEGTVAPPRVALQDGVAKLEHDGELRAFTVYRKHGEEWKLDRVVPAEEGQVELGSGQWAIAAADKQGLESRGVVVNA